MTFAEFVLEQRLLLVRRLLSGLGRRGEKIGSIAHDAGFGDLSYFNRTFRKSVRHDTVRVAGRPAGLFLSSNPGRAGQGHRVQAVALAPEPNLVEHAWLHLRERHLSPCLHPDYGLSAAPPVETLVTPHPEAATLTARISLDQLGHSVDLTVSALRTFGRASPPVAARGEPLTGKADSVRTGCTIVR